MSTDATNPELVYIRKEYYDEALANLKKSQERVAELQAALDKELGSHPEWVRKFESEIENLKADREELRRWHREAKEWNKPLSDNVMQLRATLTKIDELIRPHRFHPLPDDVKFEIYRLACDFPRLTK